MLLQKIYSILLWVQGVYTLLTALWGLVDIKSFMRVTGPKTDIWLVKTVSVLLLPITFCFFAALFLNMPFLSVSIIGIMTTAGLAAIDFYYTANRTIKWVYALDGIVDVLFLLTWIYLLLHK
jgi:hypothetical protein